MNDPEKTNPKRIDELKKLRQPIAELQTLEMERQQAKEALRDFEERFSSLFDRMLDGVYRSTPEGRFLDINPAMVKMFGYTNKEEILNIDIKKELYFEPAERGSHILDTGQEEVEIYRMRRKDGSEIWVEDHGHYVHDKDGRILFHEGILRDVTENLNRERALKKSEERFRNLYNEAPVGYHEYDLEGQITNVNQTDLEMLGYTREEMIGEFMWTFNVEEEIAHQHILAKLSGALPPDRNLERTYRRKDGTTFPVLIQDRLILDEEGQIKGIRCIIQDITERKRSEEEKAVLEEQLRQSQKMEAIGQLAGGIAHDFNNLLTVIRGYSQLTLREIQKHDPLWENIEEIDKAANRASELTRQLLAFSRRQILEFKVIDLNVLMDGMEKMLRRMIRENIELIIEPGENLGKIKADPGQIEQVILNLAVNAKDAMPSEGKLILGAGNVELDEGFVRSHVGSKVGRYVRLLVMDTGCGMTREVRERVFEPFFTTKGKGEGTGLGLSTVYGIVKQSGGYIWVSSEVGRGTGVEIYLPRVDEGVEELEEEEEEKKGDGEYWGDETILVVEDEETVRKLAVQILRRRGYRVMEALHGGDALLVCERYQGLIDLIISDVVMPGMGGPELIKRLRQVRQDFRVLYMSGYTDESVVTHGIREGEMEFIQKPFSLEELSRKVREVLDRPHPTLSPNERSMKMDK
jgi:two-component system cell cycle sensor histidine kinase/response regulator CckA